MYRCMQINTLACSLENRLPIAIQTTNLFRIVILDVSLPIFTLEVPNRSSLKRKSPDKKDASIVKNDCEEDPSGSLKFWKWKFQPLQRKKNNSDIMPFLVETFDQNVWSASLHPEIWEFTGDVWLWGLPHGVIGWCIPLGPLGWVHHTCVPSPKTSTPGVMSQLRICDREIYALFLGGDENTGRKKHPKNVDFKKEKSFWMQTCCQATASLSCTCHLMPCHSKHPITCSTPVMLRSTQNSHHFHWK